MKLQSKKERIVNALRKGVEKKKLMQAYMRGEISINELKKHGIKLSKPL